jgi:serine/threonine protein kinase
VRKGDLVGPYRLLDDFTTAGGGMSMWTLAERDGRPYFLKQFLAPKYPLPGGPGTEKTNARRRQECERFERHHHRVMDLLRSRSVPGGNLVVTIDFFRVDGIYYKVTEAIDVSAISIADIAALPLADRLLILKTVTHSLGILHAANLVHGDIKLDNVLIKHTETGHYATKLIDFDNCFVAGDTPEPEETVGDAVFLSPELAAHICGAAPTGTVSTASDIFALGVLFALYLTGAEPVVEGAGCDGVHVHERIATGGTVLTDWPDIPRDVSRTVGRMLLLDAPSRPAAADVLAALQGRPGAVATDEAMPRLRGHLLDRTAVSTSPTPLRGSLLRAGRGR